MTALDANVLAERVSAVERHLDRVAQRLPASADNLKPSTDPSDAVILHLWQAVQIVIDLAVALCVRAKLGEPATYGDAFRKLAAAGYLDDELATHLSRAAGFRNVVAHAYESLDMQRVHAAALHGPAHFREFLRVVRDVVLSQ
jgi:uncharacterized protein YutE (UPF0331/DUF86 family)